MAEARRWAGHPLGVVCVAWAALGAGEWYYVTNYVPKEGPMPYIDYAPFLLALVVGAIVLSAAVLRARSGLMFRTRLLYACPPLAYIAFVVSTALG